MRQIIKAGKYLPFYFRALNRRFCAKLKIFRIFLKKGCLFQNMSVYLKHKKEPAVNIKVAA